MATNYPGSLDTSTQQPSPSASTEMDDVGFEHDAVHTNHSGAIIALETKVGTGDSNAVASSVLAGTGSGTSAWTTGALANDISGNAATATALETARTINGTSFNGTANITVTAAADTLTGSTLNSGVTASSLTSVGTLTGLTVTGDAAFDTDTLFVDVSADRVGINDSTPSYSLDVAGTIRATDNIYVNDDLYIGGNNLGDSWSHFYDDNSNTWRTFGWDDSANSFYFEGPIQVGNGTSSAPSLSFASDSNTGFYRVANGVIGVVTNGTLHQFKTDGLHLASGDWFRAYGSGGIYWQTYGGGWNMTDSSWIRAYGSKGIVIPGGIVATLSSTSSTSGYRYVMRNTTYGTLYEYTSTREVKENIVDVASADSGAWIDALQPVTFNERWLGEGDEPEDARAWREADVQVGFIAEDVIGDPVISQFSQVKTNEDGTLAPVGWKWECVIAAAVAEIKSLRTRVADLEAA